MSLIYRESFRSQNSVLLATVGITLIRSRPINTTRSIVEPCKSYFFQLELGILLWGFYICLATSALYASKYFGLKRL